MRFLPTSLQVAARPRLACEIAPEAISVAYSAGPGLPVREVSSVPLPEGTLSPGWKTPVFTDRDMVLSALRTALESATGHKKQLSLIVPDACVRVLVLEFDTLPDRPQEALPLVRFRLRKMLPFDADTAAVSYQVLQAGPVMEKSTTLRVMVAAMPAEMREEMESLLREAGFDTGALLPSTVAALAAVPDTRSHLLVHTGARSVTTAITREGDLLLYRTLEWAGAVTSAETASATGTEEAVPEQSVEKAEDDLLQAVLVSTAYFEDELGKTPAHLWVAGHDTPQELQRRLSVDGAWQLPLRSLVQAEDFVDGAVPSGVPLCRFAGVVGALRGQ